MSTSVKGVIRIGGEIVREFDVPIGGGGGDGGVTGAAAATAAAAAALPALVPAVAQANVITDEVLTQVMDDEKKRAADTALDAPVSKKAKTSST
jgi:hypothetical protein